MGQIVGKALRDPSFALIFIGFFSLRLPARLHHRAFSAFVTELCGPIDPGSLLHGIGTHHDFGARRVAISLIGLANIVGTITAGWLGHRLLKALPAGRHLHRPHPRRGPVHPAADSRQRRSSPSPSFMGGALAGDRAADCSGLVG